MQFLMKPVINLNLPWNVVWIKPVSNFNIPWNAVLDETSDKFKLTVICGFDKICDSSSQIVAYSCGRFWIVSRTCKHRRKLFVWNFFHENQVNTKYKFILFLSLVHYMSYMFFFIYCFAKNNIIIAWITKQRLWYILPLLI